jgi:hypothetical protein
MAEHFLVGRISGDVEVLVFAVRASPLYLVGSGTADCHDSGTRHSAKESRDMTLALRFKSESLGSIFVGQTIGIHE